MRLTSFLLAGLPNVGKSLLFNKLTQTKNAIVSDHAGFTGMCVMDIVLLMINQNAKLLILWGSYQKKMMFY